MCLLNKKVLRHKTSRNDNVAVYGKSRAWHRDTKGLTSLWKTHVGCHVKENVLAWDMALPYVTKEAEKRLGLDFEEKM